MPDVDLLIRTGGEYRISNFLLWQIAYAELYFSDLLWPDFKKEDFFRCNYKIIKKEKEDLEKLMNKNKLIEIIFKNLKNIH